MLLFEIAMYCFRLQINFFLNFIRNLFTHWSSAENASRTSSVVTTHHQHSSLWFSMASISVVSEASSFLSENTGVTLHHNLPTWISPRCSSPESQVQMFEFSAAFLLEYSIAKFNWKLQGRMELGSSFGEFFGENSQCKFRIQLNRRIALGCSSPQLKFACKSSVWVSANDPLNFGNLNEFVVELLNGIVECLVFRFLITIFQRKLKIWCSHKWWKELSTLFRMFSVSRQLKLSMPLQFSCSEKQPIP